MKNSKLGNYCRRTARHDRQKNLERQQDMIDLENFVLRERLGDKNDCQHYIYQADECALHGTYVRAAGIELYQNYFTTTTHSFKLLAARVPKTCF